MPMQMATLIGVLVESFFREVTFVGDLFYVSSASAIIRGYIDDLY